MTERKHEPVFPGFGDMARRRQELVDDLAARRRAIGLSQTEVAALMGTSQSAVARLESGHSDVRFSTLERYAAALDCELVYALVPKRSLQETVEERAERIARDQVSRVRHSMALEDQQTDKEHSEREVAELRRKLLEGKRSRLWQ